MGWSSKARFQIIYFFFNIIKHPIRLLSWSSLSLSANLSYLSCSLDMSDLVLLISASIASVDFFLAVVRLLLVHKWLSLAQQHAVFLSTPAYVGFIKAEGTENDLLSLCDCMIKLIRTYVPLFRRTISIFSSSRIAAGTVRYFCLVSIRIICSFRRLQIRFRTIRATNSNGDFVFGICDTLDTLVHEARMF